MSATQLLHYLHTGKKIFLPGQYVDHIDKCKTNFNSYNLRCVTAKENAANRGVDEKIIDAIIKLHESGMSREQIRYIVTY